MFSSQLRLTLSVSLNTPTLYKMLCCNDPFMYYVTHFYVSYNIFLCTFHILPKIQIPIAHVNIFFSYFNRSLLRTASIGTIDSAELCPNLAGLTRRQIKICVRNVEVMDSVREGAEQAVIECQWQFKFRRWNCSTINGTRLFGKTVTEGK